ncbi:MAG: hypothetical protein P8Y40_13860, partial [Desulfobacterales bacterium]
FTMANVGLPGTSGFVGEFLTLLAVFQVNRRNQQHAGALIELLYFTSITPVALYTAPSQRLKFPKSVRPALWLFSG